MENLQRKALPLSRQKRQAIITFILICGDILAIGGAFWLAYQLRFTVLPYLAPFSEAAYRQLVFGTIPVWLAIFAVFQLYNPHNLFGGVQEYSRAFNAVTAGIFALVVYGFVSRDAFTISRGWLVISWLLALILVIGLRFSIRRVIYAARRRGHLLTPALIIGANDEGRALAEQLRNWPSSGLYITGFIDNHKPLGSFVSNGYKVVGRLDDLEAITKKKDIEELIIAPTALERNELVGVFQTFNPNPEINLRLSSGIFELLNTGLRIKELANVPLVEVSHSRITGIDALMKVVIDYSVAAVALVLLSPLLLLITLAVKLDSPGPAIYRRKVMGSNGNPFDAFKFRTMHVNGHEILADHPELQDILDQEAKLKDDPRITRVGNLLRKFSLDELPQFYNVILGQMSVVGPRMISPPEMAHYGKWGMNLLTVKPGITGLWQISGRSDVSYEERVRLDMHYIRNWSLWMDIYIILATVPAVLRKKGAY
jgi:exopolysaccharide biosynthesis polyprenyl glycosylphosphotransferase